MNLYVDEDTAGRGLVALLKTGGHDVFEPPRGRKPATKEPVHLAASIRMNRVMLTRNYQDFRDLHDLDSAAHGVHPGILAIRQDNDERDMKPHVIVAAISRLAELEIPIPDTLHILNAYRGR